MRWVFLLFSCAAALLLELSLGRLGFFFPVLGMTLVYFTFSFGGGTAFGMAVAAGMIQDFTLGRALPASTVLLLAELLAAFLTRKMVRRDQLLTLLPAGGAVGLTSALGGMAILHFLGAGGRISSMTFLLVFFSFLLVAFSLPFWTLILDLFATEVGLPGFREVSRSRLGRENGRRRARKQGARS